MTARNLEELLNDARDLQTIYDECNGIALHKGGSRIDLSCCGKRFIIGAARVFSNSKPAASFIKWGFKARKVMVLDCYYEIENGEKIPHFYSTSLCQQRIQCKEDKRTHILNYGLVIPYASMTIRCAYAIAKSYANSKDSIEQLAYTYGIAENTLKKIIDWLHSVLSQIRVVDFPTGARGKNYLPEILKTMNRYYMNVYEKCVKIFKKLPFQIHRCHANTVSPSSEPVRKD